MHRVKPVTMTQLGCIFELVAPAPISRWHTLLEASVSRHHKLGDVLNCHDLKQHPAKAACNRLAAQCAATGLYQCETAALTEPLHSTPLSQPSLLSAE